MLLYDISSTIAPDMPVYKNRDEKRPRFKVSRDHASGSIYEGRLDIDLHSGTHLDFPLHVLPQGESSDAWNNEQFLTRCRVLDFSASAADRIGAGDLQQKEDESRHQASEPFWEAGGTVLLKTANSAKQHFDFSFVFLDTSGAEFLAQKNIVGVGIDALGIERDQEGHPTHRTLLQKGIWILEGLRLAAVAEGNYILALMPLKIAGVEALPARAFLLEPGSISLRAKD
jgi:arylformamidase